MSKQTSQKRSDEEARKQLLIWLIAAGMTLLSILAMTYYIATSPHFSLSWSNSIDLIALPLIIALGFYVARWAARRPFGPLDEISEGWHQFKQIAAAVVPLLLLFSLAAIDPAMGTSHDVSTYIFTIFKVAFFTVAGLALFEWFFAKNAPLAQWALSILPFGLSR